MKIIKLPATEKFPAIEIIQSVCELAPQGTTVEEIRKRIRVLDALHKADDGNMTLEDADYDLLVDLYRTFKFSMAHVDLLKVLDAITEAKAPE